jgi:membrane protein YqaA with SNARE-associated domain
VLRALYNKMIALAGGPHAEKALAVISFAEASFFPIPPDVMLIPMVLSRPDRAWRSAGICAAASIIGGVLGYFIGYSLEPVGLAILHFFGNDHGLVAYREMFAKYGFFFVLGQGITPVPYKLTTIAAGLAHFNLALFMAASCITRTTRFFVVAGLSRKFGPEITKLIEKRFYLVGTIVLVVIVLGFLAVKLLAK